MGGVLRVQGKLMENNFSRALMVSGWSSFYTRPLTIILFLISIAAIAIAAVASMGAVLVIGKKR